MHYLYLKFCLCVCYIYLAASPLLAQTKWIDELYIDWYFDDRLAVDPVGDTIAGGLDLLSIDVSDDSERIYLKINLNRTTSLQEDGTLYLFVDLDNNPLTGTHSEMQGTDLIYDFGARVGRLFLDSPFDDIVFHNNVDLYSLPTVDSDTFELSFSKTMILANDTFRWSDTIHLMVLDGIPFGDRLPDMGGLPYSMSNHTYSPPVFRSDQPVITDFRLLTYNVLSDGLLDAERQPAFHRILAYLNPDILCFQEAYDMTPDQVRSMLDSLIPLNSASSWSVAKVTPDIITASRFSIERQAGSDGNGVFEINIDGQPLFIVNAHLPCCDHEAERQMEIDRILNFIRNSRDGLTSIPMPPNSPLIIAGDLNLVGSEQQMESLLSGNIVNEALFGEDFIPDWDGTPLNDVRFYESFLPFATTWKNDRSSYPPARLDFVLYTGAVLESENQFSLNTEAIHKYDTLPIGLQPGDSYLASDHLACVSDFRFVSYQSDHQPSRLNQSVRLYPNPAHDVVYIEKLLSQDKFQQIALYHASGQCVRIINTDNDLKDKYMMRLTDLSPGVYLLKITGHHNRHTYKLVVQ